MTVALRIKAGGLLVLALAGLSLGAAASIGLIPVAPPAVMVPALAVVLAALMAVKVATVGSGLLVFAHERE